MKPLSALLAAAAAALSSQGAAAADLGPLDLSGFVGVESRVFPWAARHAGQEGHGEVSLILNPELRYRSGSGKHQFSFIPFFRLDSRDNERTHFDIREAYWLYKGGSWEVLTGFNRVFWGPHSVVIKAYWGLRNPADGFTNPGRP